MRSPFAPVVLPIAALIAALVRWLMQGSYNVWTSLAKPFYVPDPDLGWRLSSERPTWLGLEVCAVIIGVIVGLVVGGWIIRRREIKTGARATLLRAATWVVAGATLAVPIAGFASGGRPSGGVDTLPAATLRGLEAGITGALTAPAGRYEVVEHPGTLITAELSAGGDKFDARFDRGITGSWQGDPAELTKPTTAEISADATAVDTGINERSKHAREAYLLAPQHPRITFAIEKLVAAKQAGADTVEFRAQGTLGFIGKTHAIEVSGTLKKPDAAALARLNLTGEILLVRAEFSIVIKETALAGDAGDFDGDRIPIRVSLVLRHTKG